VCLAGYNLFDRLQCRPGNARPVANSRSGQEARLVQIVIAVAVAYKRDIVIGESLVDLDVVFITGDTANRVE
jgi:hypothetical protein